MSLATNFVFVLRSFCGGMLVVAQTILDDTQRELLAKSLCRAGALLRVCSPIPAALDTESRAALSLIHI